MRASLSTQRLAERFGVLLLSLSVGLLLVVAPLLPAEDAERLHRLGGWLAGLALLAALAQALKEGRSRLGFSSALPSALVVVLAWARGAPAAAAPGASELDACLYLALAISSGVLPRVGAVQVALVALLAFAFPPLVEAPSSLFGSGLVRLALTASFALLFPTLFQRRLSRLRELARAGLSEEKKRLQEAARAYRLVGNVDSAERGLETSALELGGAVELILGLLAGTLGLQAAGFYTVDGKGRLGLRAAVGGARLSAALEEDEGPLSLAAARREALELVGKRAATRVAPYEQSAEVGALLCLPACRGASLEGLLYVDRRDERAFAPPERRLLEQCVDFILRAMENERAFSRLERQAREQAKLYRAAEALGSARTEAEVIELGVESARDIAAFDFAAVTLFHRRGGLHEICAVSGGNLEHLVGSTFRQNAGLVSMVVANRHPLPYRGEYDSERQVVFSRGQEVRGLPSLLVLPLLLQERALGTLVLGSQQRGVFSEEVRPTLEVLARHMAVSLANATMVSRLEEQATTDGLTGLLNKRALIRAAERRIRAAARFRKPLSVLVTDIDFFKKVNDTYGHDVGDIVIKGLGELIRGVQRDTDIAGRFGGEEFVIVCEQTDEDGAKNLAERIRRELETTTFQTELGPLSVTCSVGVATFPAAGNDWEALFKATDEALYASKRGGRNQVTTYRPNLKSASASRPVASKA